MTAGHYFTSEVYFTLVVRTIVEMTRDKYLDAFAGVSTSLGCFFTAGGSETVNVNNQAIIKIKIIHASIRLVLYIKL